MIVKDLMSARVTSVPAQASLLDAARRMKEEDVGCLPVTDGRTLVGLVTDRDIAVRGVAAGRHPARTTVAQVFTRGAITCRFDDDVDVAVQLMRERGVRRLLVSDEGQRLAGIVSLGDLARYDGRKAAAVLGATS